MKKILYRCLAFPESVCKVSDNIDRVYCIYVCNMSLFSKNKYFFVVFVSMAVIMLVIY